LKPITEESDFASELKVVFTVDQIETACRWTRENIHADPLQHRPFQRFTTVFPKTWYVKLHDGTRSTVRRFITLITAWYDIPIDPRLAIAHDGAGGMTRGGGTSVIKPFTIACCNQNFAEDATKTFGVRIIDRGTVSHACAPRPLPS
jgi:hypothetical protein